MKLPSWVTPGATFKEHDGSAKPKHSTLWQVRAIVDGRAVIRHRDTTYIGNWRYETWCDVRFDNMAKYVTPVQTRKANKRAKRNDFLT